MPLIDTQLILKKVKFIEKDLSRLKKYEDLTFDEYMADDLIRYSIERMLEKITGRIIDINYHILKTEYEILPEDYYNSYLEMGKNKVVDEKLANEMASAVGLRNALAHEYDELNDKKVFESINISLVEVPKYLSAVIKFLDK